MPQPLQNPMMRSNQPKIVQMYFDKIEILRIENGKKCHQIMVSADNQPSLIEMIWDGEVVYAIAPASAQVLVERIYN